MTLADRIERIQAQGRCMTLFLIWVTHQTVMVDAWLEAGGRTIPLEFKVPASPCSVEGCKEELTSGYPGSGLCEMHHNSWRTADEDDNERYWNTHHPHGPKYVRNDY